MSKFLKKYTIQISILFMIIGLCIIIISIIIHPFNDWSFVVDPELSGQFGSFIGGIVGPLFSLVAALLLYNTLVTQRKTLKQQKKSSKIERFESTFFNLSSTQQEIRNTIKTYVFTLNEDMSIKRYNADGREFFAYSKVELSYLWKSINSDSYLGVYNSQTADSFNNNLEELNNPYSVNYTIPDDFEYKKSQLITIEKLKYANHFYDVSKEIWSEAQDKDIVDRIKLTYGLFFQKYHYAIGHYYRHLYHIIDFTKQFGQSYDSSSQIALKYIDFIQAQMSSYEMMLLFYNAISFPKLLALLIEFNFLENLAIEDLISEEHNCINGVNLKSRKNLI